MDNWLTRLDKNRLFHREKVRIVSDDTVEVKTPKREADHKIHRVYCSSESVELQGEQINDAHLTKRLVKPTGIVERTTWYEDSATEQES
jgi:hypothetical protein